MSEATENLIEGAEDVEALLVPGDLEGSGLVGRKSDGAHGTDC